MIKMDIGKFHESELIDLLKNLKYELNSFYSFETLDEDEIKDMKRIEELIWKVECKLYGYDENDPLDKFYKGIK